MTIHDQELTESQIEALSRDTHVYTADDTATEVTVRSTWVMFKDSRYVATVYDLAVRNGMIESGRADRAVASNAYRYPQPKD